MDYLLRYTRDFPLAVVEAKASHKSAADGVQQAKEYAEMLGLKFAYATNGHDIIEFDYTTGLEHAREESLRSALDARTSGGPRARMATVAQRRMTTESQR